MIQVFSACISLLAVVVAFYAVHAASKREHDRWSRERIDRRRERLIALYADWSSRLMELLARKSQVDGVATLAGEREDAVSVDGALGMLERVFLAQREVNRAAISIMFEEGKALASEVEELSVQATAWDGKTAQTIRADMERVLQGKRLSLDAMQ